MSSSILMTQQNPGTLPVVKPGKILLFVGEDGEVYRKDEFGDVYEVGAKPSELPQPLIDGKYLKVIGEGLEWSDIENMGGIESILYADLIAKINANELKPGMHYIISDFATAYNIYDGGDFEIIETQYGENEPLIVFATSENSLAKEAKSLLHPQDIIFYEATGVNVLTDVGFSDKNGTLVDGFKGVIEYRYDITKNIRTNYDFRNVKFRRWILDANFYDNSVTYIKNSVCRSMQNGYIYMAINENTGAGDPFNNANDWMIWLSDCNIPLSWTKDKDKIKFGGIDNTNLNIHEDWYEDFLTFDIYEDSRNVNLTENINCYGYNKRLNNIVFLDSTESINFTRNSSNATIFRSYYLDGCVNECFFLNSNFIKFDTCSSSIILGSDISCKNNINNLIFHNINILSLGNNNNNLILNDLLFSKIGDYNDNIYIKGGMNISIENANRNIFINNGNNIKIGSNTQDIELKGTCERQRCEDITINDGCHNINLTDCKLVELKTDCSNINIIAISTKECKNINIGQKSKNIYIGRNCENISLKDLCTNFTIGENCKNINLGSRCSGLIGKNNDKIIAGNGNFFTVGARNINLQFGNLNTVSVGSYIYNNEIGTANNINIGNLGHDIVIGNNNNAITINNNCHHLCIGSENSNVTIGDDTQNINVGNSNNIIIGANSNKITVGNNNIVNVSNVCENYTIKDRNDVEITSATNNSTIGCNCTINTSKLFNNNIADNVTIDNDTHNFISNVISNSNISNNTGEGTYENNNIINSTVQYNSNIIDMKKVSMVNTELTSLDFTGAVHFTKSYSKNVFDIEVGSPATVTCMLSYVDNNGNFVIDNVNH